MSLPPPSTSDELVWFGESWDSAVNRALRQIEVPVGMMCFRCEQPIGAGDQGVAMPRGLSRWLVYHRVCWPETSSPLARSVFEQLDPDERAYLRELGVTFDEQEQRGG
jgi:hypothetical protein